MAEFDEEAKRESCYRDPLTFSTPEEDNHVEKLFNECCQPLREKSTQFFEQQTPYFMQLHGDTVQKKVVETGGPPRDEITKDMKEDEFRLYK